jgi:hypothetical protein
MSMITQVLNKKIILILSLFLIGIITRFPLVENMQSHWDGPQYSIAILRYSLEQETPAPPGYPVYIFLGKFMNVFIENPHSSLLFLSVLSAGFGTVIAFHTAKVIFQRNSGSIAAILFLTSPAMYFYGLTAYAYGITPVIAMLLALVVYKIQFEKKKWGVHLGIIFALALGFRIQDAFFLTPLYILGMYYLDRNEKTKSILAWLVTLSLWFIPLVTIVGGIWKYVILTHNFASDGALPSISLSRFGEAINVIIKGAFLTFTISPVFLIMFPINYLYHKKLDLKKVVFFSTWIIPALLFNIFIRSDHAGHQMTYLAGGLILISYAIAKTFEKRKVLLISSVLLIAVFNLFTFFRDRDPQDNKPYIPTSYHYSEIRKNDRRMFEKVTFIKKNYNPNHTLILTTPELWRPYMYHLKEYTMYEYDRLVTTNNRYKDIIRISKNWNTITRIDNDNSLRIIPAYTKVIFLDNNENIDVEVKNTRKIMLPYNAYISEISDPPHVIYFNYKKVNE